MGIAVDSPNFLDADTAEGMRTEGYVEAQREFEHELEIETEKAYSEGRRDGRHEYARDLYRWLNRENRALTPKSEIIEQLLDKLADE